MRLMGGRPTFDICMDMDRDEACWEAGQIGSGIRCGGHQQVLAGGSEPRPLNEHALALLI